MIESQRDAHEGDGDRRTELAEKIMALNPSADREFLSRFREDRLADYLDHIMETQETRVSESRWVRRGDTPAILVRYARE